MKRLLAISALLLSACTTDEVRGWQARREDLERRLVEVMALKDSLETVAPRRDRIAKLRAELQLTELVRQGNLSAQVFVEPGRQRVLVSGPIEACRRSVSGLSAARWLLPSWRLRIDGDHCEWEARTGEAYAALEEALLVSPPRWAPPAPQALSRDLAVLKLEVRDLEHRVGQLERELGDAAWLPQLEQRLDAIAPKLEAARGASQACVAWVLERELSLDAKGRGQVLELTHERPIHPLEPKNDARLRGLLEFNDGRMTWRCGEP